MWLWVDSLPITKRLRTTAKTMTWRCARSVRASSSFAVRWAPYVGERCHRWQQVQSREQPGQELHAGKGGTVACSAVQRNKKRFTVRRIIGSGDLWITEFVPTYDDIPSHAVSIMEFREGLIANETQYFADRFDPAPSRAHLFERAG